MPLIVEGLLTSRNEDGTMNIAPMGPIVDEAMTSLLLRPFQSSRTFQNLSDRPHGVFHVVDDVLLIAQSALNLPHSAPEIRPADTVPGDVLVSACRWYEFEVTSVDASEMRSRLQAKVVHHGTLREMFGFNRAKHAVLEATILATRKHLLPREELLADIERLRSPVEKTGGPRELQAFAAVVDYVQAEPDSV